MRGQPDRDWDAQMCGGKIQQRVRLGFEVTNILLDDGTHWQEQDWQDLLFSTFSTRRQLERLKALYRRLG
jgi:hypothetical protein